MYTTIQPLHIRAFATLAVAVVLGMFACEAARAQFQYLYGGPSCPEAGRGGVRQLANGDFIAVGETRSTGGGACNLMSDVYIVRTRSSGAVRWANYYNIGDNDSATSVLEAADGDIVVCGVTAVVQPGGRRTRDLFIMRIDGLTGLVITTHTYWRLGDEIGWEIMEASDGDFVVAGSTTDLAGNVRDPWLLRVGSTLGHIWDCQYYGGSDEYFYSLDEITEGAGIGDIVAVGGTNSWGRGMYDILVARVNGTNGAVGNAPQGVSAFGGSDNEEGRSIRQLHIASCKGDLIITGISGSRPGTLGNDEGFLLQIRADVGQNQVAAIYFGDDAAGPDGGLALREIPSITGLSAGNVVVTGYVSQGAVWPIAGTNVLLQEFKLCEGITAVGAAKIYGGTGNDWGWSVNVVNQSPLVVPGPGFVIAGFTESTELMQPGDPSQLYLIRTKSNKRSDCHERDATLSIEKVTFTRTAVTLDTRRGSITYTYFPERTTLSTAVLLCDGDDPGGSKRSIGEPETGDGETLLSFADNAAHCYPNPVVSGADLNLRFESRAGAASISVYDMLGNLIYRVANVYDDATILETVSTLGWPSGAYMVVLKAGRTASAAKIEVIDR